MLDKIEDYRDQHPFTAPVGSDTANQFELYDTGGNVAEWCEAQRPADSTSRVLRGGSWNNDDRDYLLSSYRDYYTPDNRDVDLGFRVVLSEEPAGA